LSHQVLIVLAPAPVWASRDSVIAQCPEPSAVVSTRSSSHSFSVVIAWFGDSSSPFTSSRDSTSNQGRALIRPRTVMMMDSPGVIPVNVLATETRPDPPPVCVILRLLLPSNTWSVAPTTRTPLAQVSVAVHPPALSAVRSAYSNESDAMIAPVGAFTSVSSNLYSSTGCAGLDARLVGAVGHGISTTRRVQVACVL
jgi:hypothetical protein